MFGVVVYPLFRYFAEFC